MHEQRGASESPRTLNTPPKADRLAPTTTATSTSTINNNDGTNGGEARHGAGLLEERMCSLEDVVSDRGRWSPRLKRTGGSWTAQAGLSTPANNEDPDRD